jgi:class 3 adenylate cyclase
MFIVWQVELLDKEQFEDAAKRCCLAAFRCGLSIIRQCSNYCIELPIVRDQFCELDERYSFLSVHAGLSFGLLAALDIGLNDRWEYVLIGEPIQKVASAEQDAEKGEIFVSGEVHNFLCPHTEQCQCLGTLAGNYKMPNGILLDQSHSSNNSLNSCGSRSNDRNFEEDDKGIKLMSKTSRFECAMKLAEELFNASRCEIITQLQMHSPEFQDIDSNMECNVAFGKPLDANIATGQNCVDMILNSRPFMADHPSFYQQLPPITTNISAHKYGLNLLTGFNSVVPVSPSQVSASFILSSPSSCASSPGSTHDKKMLPLLLERFLCWSKFCLVNATAAHVHESDRLQFIPNQTMLHGGILRVHFSELQDSQIKFPIFQPDDGLMCLNCETQRSEKLLSNIQNQSLKCNIDECSIASQSPKNEEESLIDQTIKRKNALQHNIDICEVVSPKEVNKAASSRQSPSSILPKWVVSTTANVARRFRAAASRVSKNIGFFKSSSTQTTSNLKKKNESSPNHSEIDNADSRNEGMQKISNPPLHSNLSHNKLLRKGSHSLSSYGRGNRDAKPISNRSNNSSSNRSRTDTTGEKLNSLRNPLSSTARLRQSASHGNTMRPLSSSFSLHVSSTSAATSMYQIQLQQRQSLRRSVREVASSWSLLDEHQSRTHFNESTNNSTSNFNLSNNHIGSVPKDASDYEDFGLDGEIRNVTVMFVHIEMNTNYCPLSSQTEFPSFGRCGFVQRSDFEKLSDNHLLNDYQQCFSLSLLSLQEFGGQLRQFIVDDKGTVLIATFGLRNEQVRDQDNVSAAVDAAQMMIETLEKKLNFSVNIGITTGKAYCGRVGAWFRHEYVVMGPSTNLAARLMSRAATTSNSGMILCDNATRLADCSHSFQPMGHIAAKGFAQPVLIFQPDCDRFQMEHKLGSKISQQDVRGVYNDKHCRRPSRRISIKSAALISLKRKVSHDVGSPVFKTTNDPHESPLKDLINRFCSHLWGRSSEIESALNFALELSTTPKVLLVEGENGSGKTSFLQSLSHVLDRYYSSDVMESNYCETKALILQSNCPVISTTKSESSFACWRRVVRLLIAQFAKLSPEYSTVCKQLNRHQERQISNPQFRLQRRQKTIREAMTPSVNNIGSRKASSPMIARRPSVQHQQLSAIALLTNSLITAAHIDENEDKNHELSTVVTAALATAVDVSIRCRTNCMTHEYLSPMFPTHTTSSKSDSLLQTFTGDSALNCADLRQSSNIKGHGYSPSKQHLDNEYSVAMLELGLSFLTSLSHKTFSSNSLSILVQARVLPESFLCNEDSVPEVDSLVEWENDFISFVGNLISAFMEQTGQAVYCLFDNVDQMDEWSRRLLNEILHKECNIIIIGTSNSKEYSWLRYEENVSASYLLLSQLPESVIAEMVSQELHSSQVIDACISERIKVILDGPNKVEFDALVKQIANLTNGNTLYVYELLQAIRSVVPIFLEGLKENPDINSHEVIINWESIWNVVTIPTNKLDEIVLRRFDRLDSSSQWLLKLLAVAQSVMMNINQESDGIYSEYLGVSVGLLVHLMCVWQHEHRSSYEEGNCTKYEARTKVTDQASSTFQEREYSKQVSLYEKFETQFREVEENVLTMLEQLVQRGEFVSIDTYVEQEFMHSEDNNLIDGVNEEHDAGGDVPLELMVRFKVAMEQQVIWNLQLSSQRQHWQHHVLRYLHLHEHFSELEESK